MKSLIKLIFFAVLAGLIFKYLNENDINVSKKISEGFEWITKTASELEKDAADTQKSSSETYNDKNSSYETGNSERPFPEFNNPMANALRNNATEAEHYESPAGLKNNDNSVYTDAEEFPVIEKQNTETGKYNELDEYARNSPEQEEVSLTSLSAWLVKPAGNDLEKARLIFTWIATHIAYDDNGFNTGNYSETTPEDVLKNRISVCQGYSCLFTALGKVAGLEIETITGYSKGITYRPGKVFGDTDHAWNAARIDGQWRLFDVTWGAGYGQGVNGKLVTVMQFDDYWFNTQPEEFIFTHLPVDDKWQFNEPKISKYQYERLPYVPGSFFKMGFSGRQCFNQALNGTVTELPEAYSANGDIKAVSLPYEKSIRPGRSIIVRVRSDNALKIAYRNNDRITDLTREGNEFTGIIRTTPGQLSLMANFGGDPMKYETFLEYVVE